MSKPMPASTQPQDKRKKRNSEVSREKILKAALHEFGTHGFMGARMERIVTRARCNIALVYYHFGDKAALYATVVEDSYADLRKKERALNWDLADPFSCLENLLRFTMGYFAQHPHFEGILRNENMTGGKIVRTIPSVQTAAELLLENIEAVIKAGQEKGLFQPELDARQLYLTITALSRFHLANSHSLSNLLGIDTDSPAWREKWADHSVALLRGYVMRPDAEITSSAVDE